ncbi:ABC transporter ATP-binding protein [Amnibacterium sp.]|uniref:ABC transporter ATP-binding protein n=1 Tax=Amnibacterium sp. TaxID=1872496 RepID=UPI003F7B5D0C
MSALEAPARTGAAVRVRGVRRKYGDAVVLDGVDLDLDGGRFLVLLGPSGSGKSTLMRAVAGLDRVGAGVIEIDGRGVSGGRTHLPPERRGLAMVFQDYALWPHMTVAQNVGFSLRSGRSQPARTQIARTLERVGLGDRGDAYPDELSGGQQQRVALARALAGDPALVLFDEPLSNLDAHLRERMRIEIATLTRASGATALYITHDQAEAFALADEIVVLDAGSIVQRGTPEEIYRRPASAFVARFTGLAATLRGRVTQVDGSRAVVDVQRAALRVTLGGEPRVRDDVEVLVRPSAVRLASEEEPGAIPGVVMDVAYRGDGYDHVVDTASGRFSSVRRERPIARGERCAVTVSPDGCFAFPL